MISKYDFELVKKEMPDLYESIEFKIAVILKKHNEKMYKLFTKYLADGEKEDYNTIIKYINSLYLDSLTKEEAYKLRLLNKNIDYLMKKLEFEYLFTFTETGALGIPPMQKDESVVNNATKIILRDKDGFYSNDESVQNRINNDQVVFATLHSYLLNKEKIMNGNRSINPRKMHDSKLLKTKRITREDVLYAANYLGYASVRKNILTSQQRTHGKILSKTKGL